MSDAYTETDEPVSVPKRPFSNIPIPCQPIPRLRTWAGGGVALASLDAALYAPVDCNNFEFPSGPSLVTKMTVTHFVRTCFQLKFTEN